MLKFGFELEGFYCPHDEIEVPPKDYPTDGFPGLVEARTIGGRGLSEACSNLIGDFIKYPEVDFHLSSGTFTAKQRAILRSRYEHKTAYDIRNLYDKAPRLLGNKTIASLQINISNMLREAYTDDKGIHHPVNFGLLDIPKIIRNLDEEFATEIKAASRQPGEYSVKDSVRLEYRSLPNIVFPFDPKKIKQFLDRIEKCTK